MFLNLKNNNLLSFLIYYYYSFKCLLERNREIVCRECQKVLVKKKTTNSLFLESFSFKLSWLLQCLQCCIVINSTNELPERSAESKNN